MVSVNDQVINQNAVDIVDETDLVVVRQVLRAHARAAGLSLVEETKFITAGSELARNIVVHATAGRGELRIEHLDSKGRRGVKATFIDDGPGIDDVDTALTDGFSSVGSMGLGLPGARRLVDEMTIASSAVSGTVVEISKWHR
ncbi:serine/threonine-protein kinase RsbT [Mycolicibacterium cyprinidarum]|uniref:Serine/threonine-protein kinase RsbT n=1 Tax=Mycolicibacterium cyprinidarum TaxID=2860311 RepID=A0ABQ4VBK1_9MYCO|nr:serine/threonine-protein kinase RsbT [Mycolicibacterium sp. NGTWS1803]GJF10547.1 serine/threonine-protein kinase RsbT [Mycolicibacterium sp. NGTWS0302]GJF17993.1 serine/threonine-protein kinase RsbT [Mycolicibacterium sp. NGTWSNA01]